MSQEEVIRVVDNEPGIVRTKVHAVIGVSTGTASEQIRVLVKKKELVQIKSGRDYKLYRRNKTEAS